MERLSWLPITTIVPCADGWRCLPGRQGEIENAQGWTIRFDERAHQAPYSLYDPEGRRIAQGIGTAILKQCCDQLMDERREFGL